MNDLSKKKFYPVIHCMKPWTTVEEAHEITNVRTAMENGADGVFLIGHRMPFSELVGIYENVRRQFPDIWIGINFLDLSYKKVWKSISYAVAHCPKLNALWIDKMPNKKITVLPNIKIFGGVAFKYINPNVIGEELTKECRNAMQFVDIATTSGSETGSPPSTEKLATIKENLEGKIPLALASGVSVENVSSFLPYVDIFLVASSICKKRPYVMGRADYLVPEKVRELADKIHSV